MNLWKDLKAWDFDTNGADITTLRVVVEIPKGSLLKYELSPDGRSMTIVRQMHKDYRYIYNYGFIPETLGGDNDPLDAIVLYPESIAAGTVLNCRVLGVVKTVDKGEQDDKLIVVPYFYKFTEKEVKKELKKIVKYLNSYKYPDQEGTYITGIKSSDSALLLITEAIKKFKEKVK